jgi:hypothetical protein
MMPGVLEKTYEIWKSKYPNFSDVAYRREHFIKSRKSLAIFLFVFAVALSVWMFWVIIQKDLLWPLLG